MSGYMTLFNWTEQGLRNARDTVNRARAFDQALEGVGGRLIGVWWMLGQWDGVVIFEAPDDEVATRSLLAVAMLGNIRTTTMRIFSEDEMTRIVQGLP